MADGISVQILTQASENIQKLFDLSTRIDERVKSISTKQEQLDNRIDISNQKHIDLGNKIAIIEANTASAKEILEQIKSFNATVASLDKRLAQVERLQGAHDERWKGVATFFIQLAWVILAAYLLTKLNLQSPSVP
jgi:septation ring formation regulator EzrA